LIGETKEGRIRVGKEGARREARGGGAGFQKKSRKGGGPWEELGEIKQKLDGRRTRRAK